MFNQRIDDELEKLITSGGDNRLLLDQFGLNRYGSGPSAHSQTQFGSCTCSSPSPRAMAAAKQLHLKLQGHQSPSEFASQQFQRIRDQLRNILELSNEVDIALTPSGTDVEMLALALAASQTDQPIVNLVVGPAEVGSGTSLAAGARYFDSLSPLGNSVQVRTAVDEQLASRVSVKHIDVRDVYGQQLPMGQIDSAVTQAVIDAATSGAHVVVHLVAHSKTGIHAPSLNVICSIKAALENDVTIVVDAAQGRLGMEAYRTALQHDCMVSFTGSKFFGGPPFCGALLVPANLRPNESSQSCLPRGFGDYFNRDTIPQSWLQWRTQCSDWTNFGLLLRWTAAIAEMDAFFQLPSDVREIIVSTFANEVENSISAASQCTIVPVETAREKILPSLSSYCSVFPFEVTSGFEKSLSKSQLKELHQRLNTDPKFGFFLGQPVQIGQNRTVLRIAAGAPLIVDVATDLSLGATLDHRLSWLRQKIRTCFKAIDSLVLTDRQFAESTLLNIAKP